MTSKKIQNKNLFGLTLAADAIEDYVAGRVLIENERVLPAIQLATTSIEKLFKSFINLMLSERFEKKIHEPDELYLYCMEEFSHYGLSFNISFLAWLKNVYKTRYSSNLFPGKEVTFGENYFIYYLDEIFFKTFEFYKGVNSELSQLYFNETIENKVRQNNCFLSSLDDFVFLRQEQRVFSLFFINGRRTDIEIKFRAFNSKDPFVFKDAMINEDGHIELNLNVGEFSPMDLPPVYYWNL